MTKITTDERKMLRTWLEPYFLPENCLRTSSLKTLKEIEDYFQKERNVSLLDIYHVYGILHSDFTLTDISRHMISICEGVNIAHEVPLHL